MLNKFKFKKIAHKPGKWLAYKLQKEKERKLILKLQEENAVITGKTNMKKYFTNIILSCIKVK